MQSPEEKIISYINENIVSIEEEEDRKFREFLENNFYIGRKVS